MDQGIKERLEKHIFPEPNTGCWLWTGPVGNEKLGYGRIRLDGESVYVHRLMYELTNGPIKDGLFVLHKCDVPACVNPSHLYLGDHKQNMKDKRDRNRSVHGPRHNFAKLNPAAVREIIRMPLKEAMAKYNASSTAIRYIQQGKTWWRYSGLKRRPINQKKLRLLCPLDTKGNARIVIWPSHPKDVTRSEMLCTLATLVTSGRI